MSFGRMHAVSGIVVMAGQLQMFAEEDGEGRQALALGVRGRQYTLKAAEECEGAARYAEFVLQTCRAASPRLRWPDASGAVEFADNVAGVVESLRRGPTGSAWLPGGAAKRRRSTKAAEPEDAAERKYLVKHFTRTWLLMADDAGVMTDSPLLAQVTVKDAHERWLPDETGSMQPVGGWQLAHLREVFGVSPYMVSMLACFAHCLSESEQLKLLKAPEDRPRRHEP